MDHNLLKNAFVLVDLHRCSDAELRWIVAAPVGCVFETTRELAVRVIAERGLAEL